MIGERIERARLAAGLSLRALADAIGVSHTMVSKYEKNETTPSSQLLIGIAKALGVRVEYFFRKAEIHLDGVEYRKRTTLTAGDRKKILADAEDQLERWAALEQFIPQAWSVGFDIPATVPERVAHDEDIETAALALREAWKLGHNPIPDLIDTLEEHGLRVVTVAGDTKQKFDGFSARCGTMPVVVVGKGWVGDRQRFTLAHELGHLVLQGRLASGLVEEKACNRFAGAFLAPRDAAINTLGEHRHWLEIQELALLKAEYGMSMQAWIHRCADLGILPGSTTRELWRLFRTNQWHLREPGPPYPREETRLFKQRVYRALAEDLIGESKAAELMGMTLRELQSCRHMDCAPDAAHQ
jgi:Zn-dependent peptidase ImmA (M78 family)/DNA-binding XRE family transcriptional regulator